MVFANRNEQENARYDDDTYSTMTKKNTYRSNDETEIKGRHCRPVRTLDLPVTRC